MKARYLTKSRFRLGLECPTKLYYTKNLDYADQGQNDPFMQALAKGGYQVGEMAKYKYCDDPQGYGITVETLVEEDALPQYCELDTLTMVMLMLGLMEFDY